jgi:hypothetical protein
MLALKWEHVFLAIAPLAKDGEMEMLARCVRQPALATPGISAVLSLVLSNDNKQELFFMVRSFIYPSVYSCRER